MYIPPYRYDTNIPRQVGLAGSSAICTACFKALLAFYSLTESEFQKPICPKFVLSVEHDELGINAGLQDRVVQVYGGLVYMDFDQQLMERQVNLPCPCAIRCSAVLTPTLFNLSVAFLSLRG